VRAAAARRDGEASVKAKEGVIERLNTILTNELTGINQYFIHAEMCRNWGFERLYEKLRAFSIDEMKDAQQIIQHILYLEGVPNLQRLGTVRVGENVPEDVQLDLAQEQEAVNTYNEAIAHCAQVGDYTTRNILEELVRDEETHVDWLETQLETIEQVGLERYLAQQIRGD
jgi:bacterioferritin